MSKGRTPRFTQEQVIKALVETRGVKTPAAEALHCDPSTVRRYIERYPAVKDAYECAIQSAIDLAQSKLIVLIEREDWRAIRFMLTTLGKDRGFTERQEIVAVDDAGQALRKRIEADIIRVYGNGRDKDDEEDDDDC